MIHGRDSEKKFGGPTYALSDEPRRNYSARRGESKVKLRFETVSRIRLKRRAQCWLSRRLVLVDFGLFNGFVWRDDPIEAVLGHGAEDKVGLADNERQNSAHKFRGILGGRLVGLTAFNVLVHLQKLGVPMREAIDVRIVPLDQLLQRRPLDGVRIANLDKRLWSMLLGRIELGEPRAKQSRLPEVTMHSDLFLLNAVFDGPDFGAIVIGGKANQNNFEDGVIGIEIDFVLKFGDQRAQPFQERHSDGIQIGRDFVRIDGVVWVPSTDGWKVMVEPHRSRIGSMPPFGSTQEYAYMSGIDAHHARRDGVLFHGLVDGDEEDPVMRDVNDDPPAGEIGHNLVARRGLLGKSDCARDDRRQREK